MGFLSKGPQISDEKLTNKKLHPLRVNLDIMAWKVCVKFQGLFRKKRVNF